MTLYDLKYCLELELRVDPKNVDVYVPENYDGTIYLTIHQNVLSQSVHKVLERRSPMGYRWIVVTEGYHP